MFYFLNTMLIRIRDSLCVVLAVSASLFSPLALADDSDAIVVQVDAPFLDMHTGPASEYPVFHVVLKGEQIAVLKKRTSWYKIETNKGVQGWISAHSLSQTQNLAGERLTVPVGSFADYGDRDIELTLYGGFFDSVTALTAALGYKFTDNIIAEATYTQALGNSSENTIWAIRVQHHIFPEWQLSPYLTIGAGQLTTTPRSNLVQSGDESRKSDQYEVGAGLRYFFSENTVIKAEYRRLTALTTRDEQEIVEEWRVGFSVFF